MANSSLPDRGETVASVIMAAGRGSRMEGFEGNKTLLPLAPENSCYEGSHPILMSVLESLPPGPKAVVVHHEKEKVIEATRGMGVTYCEQEVLNGTGGALLSARSFLEEQHCSRVIIAMGDVPFVKRSTFQAMLDMLGESSLTLLGFVPRDKRQYGILDIQGEKVKRIIEWEYWKDLPYEAQSRLRVCNSGIYAARRNDLLSYLPVLARRPHRVQKRIEGKIVYVEEYFITDLVEYMHGDGLSVGYVMANDDMEVMGVDDRETLAKAQELFRTL